MNRLLFGEQENRFGGIRMATCPECEAPIDLEAEDLEEGQTVDCPDCGTELEVISTNPLELNVTSDEDEEAEDETW